MWCDDCLNIIFDLIIYKILIEKFFLKRRIFNVYFPKHFMKKYSVFRSVSFQQEIAKYSKSLQERVDEDKLMYNPQYGNPLGTKWFRETRFDSYRIYYLIYEDLQAIYMVAISDKKDQQKTINTIKLFLEFFREELEKLIIEDNSQDKET